MQTSYEDVKAQIIEKWPELGEIKFSASCVVGELSNVCFESQNDLDSLRMICDVSSLRIVSVLLGIISITISNNEGSDDGNEFINELQSGDSNWHLPVVRKACSGKVSRNYKTKRIGCDGGTNCVSNFCTSEVQTDAPLLASDVHNFGQSLLSDGWEGLISGEKGSVFQGSVGEFRVALIKYSTKIGLKFKYIRNYPDYIHVVCGMNGGKNCEWFLKAKLDLLSGFFNVEVSVEQHRCIKDNVKSMDAVKMTSKIMGDLMIPHAKNNQHLNAKNVIDAMRIGYGIDVTYAKARRAAEFAKVQVYGDFAESYNQLKYYCHALKMTNPGSVVVLESCPKSNRFERLFISLHASIKGFESCPPLLFVDGTFLRGPCRGILLVALAKDGNKGLFPVAYGVVSAENTSNWSWFLRMIRDSITHPQNISYLSDRNSGLMSAFDETFDQPVHYFCLYHLLQNLKSRFCTGIKQRKRFIYINLFKECAYEPDPLKFIDKIHKFKEMGGEIAEKWLSKLPYNRWAISCSPQMNRYGELTSNAAESFNSWILPARSLPITKMVDYIRTEMSRWFVERRNVSNNWSGALVPRKEELWNTLSRVGIIWKVILCPGNDYEVMSLPTTRVDLRTRMCSCHEWQSTGFPCCHAVAVIRKVRADLYSDVDPFFFTSNYIKSYSWDINPVPETLIKELESNPSMPKLLSPILNRPIGRPKSNKRIPSIGETKKKKRKKNRCFKCGKLATHDHFTCAA